MERASHSRSGWAVAFVAALFLLFYLYIWLAINPRLLYETHPRFPVFFTGSAFFKAAMVRYGGPLEYVGGFLAQSYYLPWLGALVITLATGGICLATDAILRVMGANRLRFTSLIPAVIILVAHNYGFNQIPLLVGLLAALACATLYTRAPLQRDSSRVALFLALSLPLYFAEGGNYLVFAVVAGVFELLVRRRRLPALVAFLSIEAVPYLIGTYVFALDLPDAYGFLLPYHPFTTQWGRGAVALAYGVVVALVIGAGIRALAGSRRDRDDSDEAPAPTDASGDAGGRGRFRRLRPHPAVGWVLFLGAAAAAVALTVDRYTIVSLRIDEYARRRMWDEILLAAADLPVETYHVMVAQHVNEALHHTGQLPYEMFHYPQRADGLLFDMDVSGSVGERNKKIEGVKDLYYHIGDLDLRLGLVNEAEHEAHEALATHAEHGSVLYRLALINIVKEQPAPARVFLRALRRHLVYGRQAEDLLQRLEADPTLSSDPGIRRIRSVMLLEDDAGADFSGERDYLALLKRNKHNRMAFEYLMAFYLLTKDLDQFAANLPRLRDFDYPDLPRHYQEAVLLYEMDTSKRADRCGYEISDDVLEEFAHFWRDAAGSTGRGAIAGSFMREYGDTYFHYHLTGLSGLGSR